MKQDIVIVGAGGLGREVYQLCKESFDKNKYNIKGFLANNKNELDEYDIDMCILGHEDNYDIQPNDRFIVAVGDISRRKKIVSKLKTRGAQFTSLIHPTAVILPTSKVGKGAIIFPYCTVSDHSVIGEFVLLNIYAYCAHDAKIGDYSVLCPYATLNGGATIDEEVFMGTRSTITVNKIVGKNSVIGAHSVVLHNIPEHSKVLGISKNIL